MTPDYLHMMWRRIEFLGSVLDMGYNFVFTDTDIMWLRDPFKQFYKDVDFQIACDYFNGNSDDLNNKPNGGFNYVKSNNETIWFYKFWFHSRNAYPKLHDQDVLNKIKKHPFISNMKLKIKFLSTTYFGGFCEHRDDFNKVLTMHANCCVGLENKVNDLKILLEDWKKYMALSENEKKQSHPSWSAPQSCRTSFQRAKPRKKSKGRL
ncbi:Nucleotide-diphospho-sugar transferase [Spatholobus suberectus]|nr:Nucleotide-diphospho-sugar transferase [Spatholobus suberectus]